MRHVASAGACLSVHELTALQVGMLKLQKTLGAASAPSAVVGSPLYFWGRIRASTDEYYVAFSVGASSTQCPAKNFYFARCTAQPWERLGPDRRFNARPFRRGISLKRCFISVRAALSSRHCQNPRQRPLRCSSVWKTPTSAAILRSWFLLPLLPQARSAALLRRASLLSSSEILSKTPWPRVLAGEEADLADDAASDEEEAVGESSAASGLAGFSSLLLLRDASSSPWVEVGSSQATSAASVCAKWTCSPRWFGRSTKTLQPCRRDLSR